MKDKILDFLLKYFSSINDRGVDEMNNFRGNITSGEVVEWLKKVQTIPVELSSGHNFDIGTEKRVPLMKRPSDESVRSVRNGILGLDDMLQHTFYGSEMHDRKFHGGEDTWSFPKGVRERLKDDKLYRVWYTRSDAADPCDTSSHYCVYYIKEIR